jgi:WD40 repeat protein
LNIFSSLAVILLVFTFYKIYFHIQVNEGLDINGILKNLEVITSENAQQLKELTQLEYATPSLVHEISWSPNGETLAVAGSKGLALYHAANFSMVQYLSTSDIYSLSFDSHVPLLAFADGLNIHIWDLQLVPRHSDG